RTICTQFITVIDNIEPVFVCPSNITNMLSFEYMNESCEMQISNGIYSATDNYYRVDGHAFAFDGASHVELSNLAGRIASSNWTVEFLMQAHSTSNVTAEGTAMFAVHDAAGNDLLTIRIDGAGGGMPSGGLLVSDEGGGVAIGDNMCYHIAVVGDATENEFIVYVNGVQEFPIFNTNLAFDASMQIFLGMELDGAFPSDFYVGRMDELRIWKTNRSLAQLQQNMFREVSPFETNLVSRYSFEDGPGSRRLRDDTDLNNYGVILNADSLTAWETPGCQPQFPLVQNDRTFTNDASDIYRSGTNVVVWTANDDANIVICTQIVYIIDDIPPGIGCTNQLVFGVDTNLCTGAVLRVSPPDGSDNCDFVDYALCYDGVDDYVSIPFSASNLTAFTVEMWIQRAGGSGGDVIFQWADSLNSLTPVVLLVE
ncbi:MAG: LamG-like jellyroll fold domain-containing protein, partial [Verrucomicrobiota bacterium]